MDIHEHAGELSPMASRHSESKLLTASRRRRGLRLQIEFMSLTFSLRDFHLVPMMLDVVFWSYHEGPSTCGEFSIELQSIGSAVDFRILPLSPCEEAYVGTCPGAARGLQDRRAARWASTGFLPAMVLTATLMYIHPRELTLAGVAGKQTPAFI